MVSLSCAIKGNHKGICLHHITRRGAPSEFINFPDYITCILNFNWPRGSTGVQRYGCIPRSAANNLGEIPKNLGAPNLLF